jgi:hypothetical protein
MANAVMINSDEIRELTNDELDEAGGGERPPSDPHLVGSGVFHVAGIIIHE